MLLAATFCRYSVRPISLWIILTHVSRLSIVSEHFLDLTAIIRITFLLSVIIQEATFFNLTIRARYVCWAVLWKIPKLIRFFTGMQLAQLACVERCISALTYQSNDRLQALDHVDCLSIARFFTQVLSESDFLHWSD